MDKPKITVLMSVYNGEKHLKESIDSILNQTFEDFEFLIITDPSTDKSIEIIKSYTDKRIKLVQNEQKQGLVNSLNIGLDIANGKYIARMDCDDISLPQRLQKQFDFMETHPDIGICGSLVQPFGAGNHIIWRTPEHHDQIVSKMIFASSLFHPTVMIRKSSINGLYYDPECTEAEDYEFWARIADKIEFANIQEILVKYRVHEEQKSSANLEKMVSFAKNTRLTGLKKLGLNPTEEELNFHQSLSIGKVEPVKDFVNKAESWFLKLKEVNNQNKSLPEPAFSYVIAEQWFLVCIKTSKLGIWSCRKFFTSSLSRKNNLSLKSKLKLIYRCIKY
jgi:glycosyltransferase involved in cell wall biosynthesis